MKMSEIRKGILGEDCSSKRENIFFGTRDRQS
jgi:hypothetical protein